MTSTKKTTKDWREFEKLVALIEFHLAPKGAIIKSPDKIRDKITGELREVDASIRYQVGSASILITIECRDRKRTEDSRWIEQLAQKQNDIGANATIAVSSRKFSVPALEKAKFYGIETRLLNDINENSIRKWADKVETIIFQGVFHLSSVVISLVDDTVFSFPTKMEIEFKEKGIEYKFIHLVEENLDVSIKDLLLQNEDSEKEVLNIQDTLKVAIPPKTLVKIPVDSNFSNLFEDVPLDGEVVKKLIRWEFTSNGATVLTEQGIKNIMHLDAELQMKYKAYPAGYKRLLSYKSEDATILNVEERSINLDSGETLNLTISGKP